MYITACAMIYSRGEPVTTDHLKARMRGATAKHVREHLRRLLQPRQAGRDWTARSVTNAAKTSWKRALKRAANWLKRYPQSRNVRHLRRPRGSETKRFIRGRNSNLESKKEGSVEPNGSTVADAHARSPPTSLYQRLNRRWWSTSRSGQAALGARRASSAPAAVASSARRESSTATSWSWRRCSRQSTSAPPNRWSSSSAH